MNHPTLQISTTEQTWGVDEIMQRLTVTANAQNILQHFQEASAPFLPLAVANACGRPCLYRTKE